MTNKEIAASLTIELATVKNHVHSILRKVGVTRRDHATRWLREGVPVASGPALPTSE
jgi:DNA-binding NarL/FixJ family response regulator